MSFREKYGPWAVITGASDGTGRAFAERIAGEGVNCILVGRREAPLREVADALRAAHGIECVTASIDLYDPAAFAAIEAAVGAREVGLLVNNAGGDTNSARFLDAEAGAWENQITRNVTTLMRCCHHFGRAMRERRRGGILTVGSGSCYGGASFMAVYAGTKAFDMCFSEGLWAELRPRGVDVLYFALGRTDTPSFRQNLAKRELPVPPNLAAPADVARTGLERLPFGPIHNMGVEDDATGPLPMSAASRRARVLMIDEATKDVFR